MLGEQHEQARPLRGQARSHRYSAGLEVGAKPVGAGLPAKRPVSQISTSSDATSPALRRYASYSAA
ncbi:hypothetical protein AL532_24725 [Pseudomonas monteilii]|nr:hypothetical protein AL532_24725 [Pseudomonas monteilii]